MPYPVLPPEPPAIIQTLPHEQLSPAASDSYGISTSASARNLAKIEARLPLSSTTVESVGDRSLNSQISGKQEIETQSHNAVDLGSSIGIGLSTTELTPSAIATESLTENLGAIADSSSATSLQAEFASVALNLEPTISPVEFGTLTTDALHPLIDHQVQQGTSSSQVEPIADTGIPTFWVPEPASPGRIWNQLLQLIDSPPPVAQVPSQPLDNLESQILPAEHIAPAPPGTNRTDQTSQTAPSGSPPPVSVTTESGVLEVTADRQEFNEQRQTFTAEGNVVVRFQGAVIDANRVQGNLRNFIAVAEGDAALTRGQQVFRGARFTYNFVQNSGSIQNATGTVFATTSGTDLTFTNPAGGFTTTIPERPLSDRLLEGQPPQQITNPGGIGITAGTRGFSRAGNINRIRFEAQEIEFYPRGWTARGVRLTNDPFSPPELELRADRAVFTQLSPLRDEIRLSNSRIVFDQGLSVPTFRRRIIIDRTEREPPLFQIRYDGRERGGLYIERTFDLINTSRVQWSLTPQFLIQRTLTQLGGNIFNPAAYGFRSGFDAVLGPRTRLRAIANTPTLFFNELPDKLRASLRLRHVIGTRLPHTLSFEYSYRDRLFNGSLGNQTVRSSLGGVITSPNIPIGKTGVFLTYQGGIQYVNARSDRFDLLDPNPITFLLDDDDRIALGRFQASAQLIRPMFLWRGKPLPATASQGLRYTPVPVVPFVQFVPLVRGTTTWYTSNDYQNSLLFSVGITGQIGHFSRPFLDYTGFNIRFSQILRDGISPFYFDRVADTRVLSFGLTQQIYGPIRVGFQTSINVDTSEIISTDYTLEYSRRTYGVILRVNPERQLGSINLRISDFNWTGAGEEPFRGSGGRLIDAGVIQEESF